MDEDTVQPVDLSKWEMREGEWYAFRLDGREFFALVHLDGSIGFCDLTEIPNPYSEVERDAD